VDLIKLDAVPIPCFLPPHRRRPIAWILAIAVAAKVAVVTRHPAKSVSSVCPVGGPGGFVGVGRSSQKLVLIHD
jgi:hypothetical protein